MIAVLLLAGLSAGIASAGEACVVGLSYEQYASSSPLIFEGKVTFVPGEVVLETADMPDGPVHWKGLRVWFRIERVGQGEAGSDIEIVYTHHAQDIHGRFDPEERFIVWAYQRHGRWETNDCSATIERELAPPEMLAFLDSLKK